jgi:hypothetical protein
MARPTVYDEPMTPAERQRRHRNVDDSKISPAEKAFYMVPMRVFAKHLHCSERHLYHHKAFQRDRLIEWPTDILNNKYGRIGMSFLAEVCRYSNAAAQTLVRDCIVKNGAPAGRALWGSLVRKHYAKKPLPRGVKIYLIHPFLRPRDNGK